MSYALTSQVLRSYDGPRAALPVLLALADRADPAGVAWPSVQTIADLARVSTRQVQFHLAALVAAGWISPVGSRNGGRAKATKWRVLAPGQTQVMNLTETVEERVKPASPIQAPERVKSSAGKGEVLRTERVKPASPEAIKKRSGSDQRKTTRESAMPIALPSWLPAETWEDFTSHRKSLRKPLTPRAADLLIKKLHEMRQQGNNPVGVVEQSIMNGWVGVFPLNGDSKRKTQAGRREKAAAEMMEGMIHEPHEPIDITGQAERVA